MASATFSPAAGTDDGYVSDPAGYNNNQNGIITAAGGYHSWVRFPNVTIPQGAVINSATLGVACQTSNAVDEWCAVYCNDVNDATYPQTHAAFDAKALTAASARWDKGGAWVVNQHYKSDDITSPVQEVINRSGWSSGNALMVIIKHASLAGLKYIKSHNLKPHVTLSVDWTPVTGGSGAGALSKLIHHFRKR
jgi:hypothetical protein